MNLRGILGVCVILWSAASYANQFTPITNNVEWQDLSILNELVTSINEHKGVLGQDQNMPIVTEETDISGTNFWFPMQKWIMDNYTNFVDHTVNFSNIGGMVRFDITSFSTNANWESSLGFRRTTNWVPGTVDGTWQNDVTFSYGTIQAGDIIGPWIFYELQHSLDALRWTAIHCVSTNLYTKTMMGSSTNSNENARQNTIDEWPGSWTNNNSQEDAVVIAYVLNKQILGSPNNFMWWCLRYKGKIRSDLIATNLAHQISFWGQVRPVGGQGTNYTYSFLDIDTIPLFPYTNYCFYTTDFAVTNRRTSVELNANNDDPITTGGISDPGEDGIDRGWGYYIDVRDTMNSILKWQFTYTNAVD